MAVMFFEVIFYVKMSTFFAIFCCRYAFQVVALSETAGMASAKPVEWVAALITRFYQVIAHAQCPHELSLSPMP